MERPTFAEQERQDRRETTHAKQTYHPSSDFNRPLALIACCLQVSQAQRQVLRQTFENYAVHLFDRSLHAL